MDKRAFLKMHIPIKTEAEFYHGRQLASFLIFKILLKPQSFLYQNDNKRYFIKFLINCINI